MIRHSGSSNVTVNISFVNFNSALTSITHLFNAAQLMAFTITITCKHTHHSALAPPLRVCVCTGTCACCLIVCLPLVKRGGKRNINTAVSRSHCILVGDTPNNKEASTCEQIDTVVYSWLFTNCVACNLRASRFPQLVKNTSLNGSQDQLELSIPFLSLSLSKQ